MSANVPPHPVSLARNPPKTPSASQLVQGRPSWKLPRCRVHTVPKPPPLTPSEHTACQLMPRSVGASQAPNVQVRNPIPPHNEVSVPLLLLRPLPRSVFGPVLVAPRWFPDISVALLECSVLLVPLCLRIHKLLRDPRLYLRKAISETVGGILRASS